jgi:uncharacterized membrane protein (UPF0127 family)
MSAVATRPFTLVRDDGDVVCRSCRPAATFLARLRGLLGRRGLADGEGLLIKPTSSIHTFFMRFALDVAFLDRDGRVVKLVPGLRPWRMTFARGARSALELATGEIARSGLRIGDRLRPAGAPGS